MKSQRDDFPLSPAEVFALLLRYPLTVLGCAAFVVLAAFVYVGTRTPVWEATATLLLRSEEASYKPAWAEGSDLPNTASELALLTARGPAEAAVLAPFDGMPATPDNPDAEHHLGLQTTVDDESRLPLRSFARQLMGRPLPEGRLFARAERTRSEAPELVRVRFLDGDRVRVALPGRFGTDRRPKELAWTSGVPVDYLGTSLLLEPRGDVVDRSFLVRAHNEREAVRGLLERVHASESEPGSGVLYLSLRDTDPFRAAETVNALCRNYLDQAAQRTTDRARDAHRRFEGELARLRSGLDEAHQELVQLQRENPMSVHTGESAKFILLDLVNLEVQLADAQLQSTLVEEALAELEEGRLGALSKVSEQTADKSTLIVIEHITHLAAQARMQERSDAGAYRHLLQVRLLELEKARGAVLLEITGLLAALTAVGEEGVAALSRFGGEGPGATAVSPVTGVLADRAARLAAERDGLLAGDYTAAHPDVVRIDAALAELLGRVEEQLRSRLASLRELRDQHDAFVEETRTTLEDHPELERAELEGAIERLRPLVADHLASLHDSLRERAASISAEITHLRANLASLPASEREQLGPLQLVDEYKARVAELLQAKEETKIAHAFAEPPAELIDPATPLARRESPRMGFSLLLAAAIGLALGLLVAFVRDRAFGIVEGEADLADSAGVSLLAAVPDFRRAGVKVRDLRELRLALAESPSGPLAAAYRSLRASLRFPLAKEGCALGVTSAGEGEGKSATAIGLATALADGGQRVLLVKASPDPNDTGLGLFPSLAGEARWSDAVVSSGRAELHLLPAGAVNAVPADLFASKSAAALVADLAGAYDVVLFDLPALDVGAEVETLAPKLTGVLLVVSHGLPRRAALRAAERLRRAGAATVGAVLNRAGGGGSVETLRGVLVKRGAASRPRPSAEERAA